MFPGMRTLQVLQLSNPNPGIHERWGSPTLPSSQAYWPSRRCPAPLQVYCSAHRRLSPQSLPHHRQQLLLSTHHALGPSSNVVTVVIRPRTTRAQHAVRMGTSATSRIVILAMLDATRSAVPLSRVNNLTECAVVRNGAVRIAARMHPGGHVCHRVSTSRSAYLPLWSQRRAPPHCLSRRQVIYQAPLYCLLRRQVHLQAPAQPMRHAKQTLGSAEA